MVMSDRPKEMRKDGRTSKKKMREDEVIMMNDKRRKQEEEGEKGEVKALFGKVSCLLRCQSDHKKKTRF